MKQKTKFKQTEIGERLEEIKKFPLKMECRVLRIVEGKEGDFNICKENLIKTFESLIRDYQKLTEIDKSLNDISHLVLLNSAFEGLIKIILFFDSPIDYLNIDRRRRTIGNLKKDLIKVIRKKETDEKKITLIKTIFELIKELRNNFIHFPFYSEYDYRFEYMYFQMMAYLIDINELWDLINYETKNEIQKMSQNKPSGIDLLGGMGLYEE